MSHHTTPRSLHRTGGFARRDGGAARARPRWLRMTRGLLTWALALALLGTVTGVGSADAAPETTTRGAVGHLTPGVAEVDIDGFWGEMFADAGLSYVTPLVVGFGEPITTGCGFVQPHELLAFHCAPDQTVYYSYGAYEQAHLTYGDAAWINVMAHEWGHHVQAMLGLNSDWRLWNDMIGIELEANCLSGVYVEDAYERELLDRETIAVMLEMFAGDTAHGSGDQLRAAFERGYDAGVAGCGIPL